MVLNQGETLEEKKYPLHCTRLLRTYPLAVNDIIVGTKL
jgi:hypothetical protein